MNLNTWYCRVSSCFHLKLVWGDGGSLNGRLMSLRNDQANVLVDVSILYALHRLKFFSLITGMCCAFLAWEQPSYGHLSYSTAKHPRLATRLVHWRTMSATLSSRPLAHHSSDDLSLINLYLLGAYQVNQYCVSLSQLCQLLVLLLIGSIIFPRLQLPKEFLISLREELHFLG